MFAALLVAAAALAGCGPASEGLGVREGAANCTDADGDGFGIGCPAGADCDDADAEITECEDVDDDGEDPPGKSDKCKKGETRECKIYLGTNGGVTTCWIGTETCEEGGEWGECVVDV